MEKVEKDLEKREALDYEGDKSEITKDDPSVKM